MGSSLDMVGAVSDECISSLSSMSMYMYTSSIYSTFFALIRHLWEITKCQICDIYSNGSSNVLSLAISNCATGRSSQSDDYDYPSSPPRYSLAKQKRSKQSKRHVFDLKEEDDTDSEYLSDDDIEENDGYYDDSDDFKQGHPAHIHRSNTIRNMMKNGWQQRMSRKHAIIKSLTASGKVTMP